MEFKDFEYLMYIIQVIVIGLGLIGNAISFIIFSRKTFQNNSISTYCRALALFDSLVLEVLIQNIGEGFFNYSIESQNNAVCKIFFYILALYSSIPAWILVAFSVDKMLSMRKHSIIILRKKRFQWSLVAVITVINLLLYIEILIYLKPQNLPFYYDLYYCDISNLEFFNVFIIGFLIETAIMPFMIMFITSIVTIRSLIHSRKTLESTGVVDKKRMLKDAKFAISSLAFNIMFITLKTPIVVFYIQVAFNADTDLFFYQTATFLFYLNASSNFLVHLITNSIFRRELLTVFKLRTPLGSLASTVHHTHSNRVIPSTHHI